MSKTSCRITEIRVENFKSVKAGSLSFHSYDRGLYQSSILGLYGQNGSGKTTLIDALSLLKYALTGKPVPSFWGGLINLGAEEARFRFCFSLRNAYEKYRVYYSFSLGREEKEPGGNMNMPVLESKKSWESRQDQWRPVILRESLSLSYQGLPEKEEASPPDWLEEGDPHSCEAFSPGRFPDELIRRFRKEKIIDTDTSSLFLPLAKYRLLIGPSKENLENLRMEKILARKESRSFLFSWPLLKAIERRAASHAKELDSNLSIYWRALRSLVRFGNLSFFVLNSRQRDTLSLVQPLVRKEDLAGDGAASKAAAGAPAEGRDLAVSAEASEGAKAIEGLEDSLLMISLPFDFSGMVPEDLLPGLDRALSSINAVLPTLIPGMSLEYEKLGSQRMMDGRLGTPIQLMARRDDLVIPLKYESQGNRKIISILQLLILVYNEPSVTVAIDELDSGIFEYLLGEILKIIARHGYGQLIFTSHNLRPLEILNPQFVAFSTTNPSNAYIRFRTPKDAKNLRDFYYRNILLGGQGEELYRSTHNPEIALALRAAANHFSEHDPEAAPEGDGLERDSEDGHEA